MNNNHLISIQNNHLCFKIADNQLVYLLFFNISPHIDLPKIGMLFVNTLKLEANTASKIGMPVDNALKLEADTASSYTTVIQQRKDVYSKACCTTQYTSLK